MGQEGGVKAKPQISSVNVSVREQSQRAKETRLSELGGLAHHDTYKEKKRKIFSLFL